MTSRRAAPVDRPVALTVAGSDSGGGAGVQADLKTMEAAGAFGTSVVTAVTAQNTRGVESSFVVPVEEIEAQLDAVLSDFDVRAGKTGMLASAPVIELVAERVASAAFPVVVDPVMVAASGDRLLAPDGEEAYEDLVAEATLVTPNADEATVLTGREIESPSDGMAAGEGLVAMGAEAALVKGGHVGTDDRVIDTLVTADATQQFEHPRIETRATHGSGCTLSSMIAARLALGDDLRDAVAHGTAFMERAVRYHHAVGEGPGAVHHLAALRERADRQPTQEAVEGVVASLVERNVRPLVPEVGMNVVGATAYAEATDEVAAVEGRITKTIDGVAANRGVRFGASSHVARFLLSVRERDPAVRFGVNCRFDDDVEAALDALAAGDVAGVDAAAWTVAEYDRDDEPAPDEEGSTMGWGARRAVESADETPTAVIDRGAHGKEPITKLLATDPDALEGRTFELLDALDAADDA